jgi:hypothetical protein
MHAAVQTRDPANTDDRVMLHRIQQRHAAAGDGIGPGLTMAWTGGSAMLEDVAPGSRDRGRLALFEPHADLAVVEFLAGAHEDMRFVLGLLSRSFAVVRELRAQLAEQAKEMSWYKQALESAGEPSTPPTDPKSGDAGSGSPAAGEWPAVDRSAGSPQDRREAPMRPSGEKKDYSAEAAMRCNDPIFVAFLVAKHGLEQDADEHFIAAAQRKALKVGSRKILNTDPAAAARWRDMKADYEAWKQHG